MWINSSAGKFDGMNPWAFITFYVGEKDNLLLMLLSIWTQNWSNTGHFEHNLSQVSAEQIQESSPLLSAFPLLWSTALLLHTLRFRDSGFLRLEGYSSKSSTRTLKCVLYRSYSPCQKLRLHFNLYFTLHLLICLNFKSSIGIYL